MSRVQRGVKKKKGPMMFGNLDHDEEFEFEQKCKKNLVVRHSRMENTTSGVLIEDPGSVYYSLYSETIWDEYVDQPEEMGESSRFEGLGITVKVLHDPQETKGSKD